MKLVERLIDESPHPSATRARGESLYRDKPKLRKGEGTWSQEEYGTLGLQRVYLSFKSFQRFTETYVLLERAFYRNIFASLATPAGEPPKPLRVVSAGGGPGFELFAFKKFAERVCPRRPLELVSLDLMPKWKPYVENMNMEFYEYDITGKVPLVQCSGGKPVEWVIISYVLIYCCTEETADMLADLIFNHGVKGIFISERAYRQDMAKFCKDRNLQVVQLLDQSMEHDDRQLAICHPSMPIVPPLESQPGARKPLLTFPNVPWQRGSKFCFCFAFLLCFAFALLGVSHTDKSTFTLLSSALHGWVSRFCFSL